MDQDLLVFVVVPYVIVVFLWTRRKVKQDCGDDEVQHHTANHIVVCIFESKMLIHVEQEGSNRHCQVSQGDFCVD